ncbi:MAG: NADH/ubiquinone/plastoquinone (complex I) [Gemmatimonadales bacterium]|nr:MAG: NADH/ubiquinone/plastoquinone (complex I) [Gemmatimonadales bacterium]
MPTGADPGGLGALSVMALAILTWAAVGIPAAIALAWAVRPLRPVVIALAPVAAVPAGVLAAVHLGAWWTLPRVDAPSLFLGLSFEVDLLGGAFLALAAFLWTAAGVYARSYHREDPRRGAFFGFFAATMAGNMGLVLAADLLTFYLCFAIMTLAGWGLVVHDRSAAALRAGRVYIILALLGEVAILAGLFSLAAAAGGGLPTGLDLTESWGALGGTAPLVAGLVVAGFGVKAGLLPLHMWLPLAHPVAPTAASALLSGVMVKAGVLGWIRILPAGGEVLLPGVGETLVVLGIAGAFHGVVVGLAQDNPKTVLAYSSVSQLGYLTVGTGLLALLPGARPLVLGGILLYALHHGVAKAALFLSVGLAQRMPPGDRRWRRALGVLVLLPALALAGAPLTSGIIAKGALKQGLGELGGSWYAVIDPLLLLAAFGTTLLLARFWVVLAAVVEARHAEAAETHPSEADPPPPPWGLVLPLGCVVLAAASAPAWLGVLPFPPGTREALGGQLPGVLADAVGAVLPIGAGIALALLMVRSAGSERPGAALAAVARLRIPPGDLVVLFELLLARRPGAAGAVSVLTQRTGKAMAALEAAVVRLHGGLERQDLVLMRGPVFGALLFGLVVVLALALR